jgi:sensor histidine kinase YesM
MTIHAKYRDRQLAAVRLEAQLTEARLDALRTHLQPHFLFNSLHSIAWLARSGDNAGVVRLVAALSDLLRSVLDASTRRVPLRDELLLVERYLEIQRVRFADRLTTKFEIAADTNEVPVPPLVVQPLVENALRHGLTPRPGPGTLLVRAFRDDGLLVVVVEDDGSGLPGGFALESCIGTGLRNLASRLAAEYGPRQSVGIEPRAGGGVRATLRVPFETV